MPEGREEGSPVGVSILTLALDLRFVHAIRSRRLTRLFLPLFALSISEGALEAMVRRAKLGFDAALIALLTRLRRARVEGRTHGNWVLQNDEGVLPIVRPSRGRAVVIELLAGHRPEIWVCDLDAAPRGHAERWQVCLAHHLRDLRYAIAAGDIVFAPRRKALLLPAVVLRASRRVSAKQR